MSSQQAMTPVVEALKDALRSYVARRVPSEHIDDVVQDIFLRMHERAGDLREAERLPGWAFRVAQSVVADHHRKRRKEVAAPNGDGDGDVLEEREGDNVNEVVAGWLRPLLTLLPDEYEEALTLVDVEGLPQRAYAERAGLSLSGAKSRVQRGRKMLEQLVRGCCDLEVDARGNILGYERRCAVKG
ncbi:MAG: sigma-70 family RNA polymerase sigma factor [Polyangiaceae bacterium]